MMRKMICLLIILVLCISVMPVLTSEKNSGDAIPDLTKTMPDDGQDSDQDSDIEGLVIKNGSNEISVSWDDIDREAFEGKLVNGKGITFFDKYEGSELRKVLADHGVKLSENSVITVTAEDGYTAEFTGAELLENGKVYIALSQNGIMLKNSKNRQGARVFVFGDPDSKRAVKRVTSISVN